MGRSPGADRTAEYRKWSGSDAQKNADLKWRYGITLDEYNHLLAAQLNRCALCEKECPSGKRLAVDHDHVHGFVRGLLCVRCNTAVAVLEGNPGWSDRAHAYLEASLVS